MEGLPSSLFENFSGGFRIKFLLPTAVTGKVTENEGVSEGVNEGVNEGVTDLLAAIRTKPGHRVPFYAERRNTPLKSG